LSFYSPLQHPAALQYHVFVLQERKGRCLLSPIAVGSLHLSHRVLMAPLTRLRATVPGDVPSPIMLDYYAQRASEGGFIISEATTISVTGRG
jgi:N-ethylmaleimide reductase